MNLSFHDSEVRRVQVLNDGLHIPFSAAAVSRASPTGRRDGDAGYVQNLELVLGGATWTGPLNECFGHVSDGQLRIDGVPVRPLPVPCALAGAMALELTFSHGTRLCAQATSMTLRFVGEPRFHEAHAC